MGVTLEEFNAWIEMQMTEMEETCTKKEVAVGTFHFYDPKSGELRGGKIDPPPSGKN